MQAAGQLFLDTKRSKHFDGRHPWVLANSIIEPTIPLSAGSVVELLQPNGSWIGRGIYNPQSRIRVRIYQWDTDSSLDEDWLRQQLARSIEVRQIWMRAHHQLDAVRLVNSEGDGLSGLIVDRFGPHLVIQITSLAMLNWLDEITDWLKQNLQVDAIALQIDKGIAANEGIEPRNEWRFGNCPAEPFEIVENDVKLKVDLASGQKTGYYLDQRDNRLRAAKWNLGGAMLDVCCYQGGFSLAACKFAQPSQVVAVDSSRRALEHAEKNAEENGFNQIEFVQADCFDYLDHAAEEKQQFQTVVLDPPRMAGHRVQIASALRAYHRLNACAVGLLAPGGILVTCSCSGRVKRSDFMGVLASVAKRSRRRIQILEALGADFDHPVDANCPESDYLKCLICRVY